MSSFLCFICHSTINSYTSEEVREKYKDVVGMHLCLESHLCYICCYLLKKLWLFKSICLKRSLEYPVLFSEKGTLNLHRSEIETQSICSKEGCNTYQNRMTNSKSYHFNNEDSYNIYENNEVNPKINYDFFDNERNDFEDFLNPVLAVSNVNKDLECSLTRTDPERSIEINSLDENDPERSIENNCLDDNDPERSIENNSLDENDPERSIENNSLDDNGNDFDTNIESNEVSNNETKFEQNNDKEFNHNTNYSYTEEDKNETVETQNEDLLYINTEVKETQEKVSEKKKKKSRKKEKDFETIELTLEEQKMELDKKRKSKKYLEAQFKCYNCALGFLFKDTYQTHMMRHEESNGEHKCDICTLRFANPAVLRSHRKAHKFRYHCGSCDRQVTSRAHLARCQVTSEASCHLCGRLFQNATGLRQHLKRFHKKNGGRTYSCNVCGKSYNNQAAVRTHMIKHVNRSFPCDVCSSTFSSPYTLNQHKKLHNTETSLHHCTMCDVTFNTRKSLLAHIRNTMSHQQTLFECPICSRVCANHRSLALHMERVHSTNKNYACPSCPATYSNSKSLVRHIGSHTKKVVPRTAVCHLCGNSFKGNTKLNRHLLKEVCEKEKLEEELSSYYQNVIDPEPLLN